MGDEGADALRELAAREARLGELRRECAAGTYHVDPALVAEAVLRSWATESSGAIDET